MIGPPTIHIGQYPDGKRVQLLDLGSAGVTCIPIDDDASLDLPHVLWHRQGNDWVYDGPRARSLPTERSEP